MDTQPIRTSEEGMREMSRLPLIVGISVGVGAILVLLIAIVSCFALRVKRRQRPMSSATPIQVEEATLETPHRSQQSTIVRASEENDVQSRAEERSVRRKRLKRKAGASTPAPSNTGTSLLPRSRPRADSTNRSAAGAATTATDAGAGAAVATTTVATREKNAQVEPPAVVAAAAIAVALAATERRRRPVESVEYRHSNDQPGPSRQPLPRRRRSPEPRRTNESGVPNLVIDRATWPNASSAAFLESERLNNINNDNNNNSSGSNNITSSTTFMPYRSFYSYYPSATVSPPSSRPATSDQRRPSTSGKTSRTLSPVPSFFYSATNGADEGVDADDGRGEGTGGVDLASPRPSSDLDHSPLDLDVGSRATTVMDRSPRSDLFIRPSSRNSGRERGVVHSPRSQGMIPIIFGAQDQSQRPSSRGRLQQLHQERERNEMTIGSAAFESSTSFSPPSSFVFPLPPPPAAAVVAGPSRRQSQRVGDALLAALESRDPVVVAARTTRPAFSVSSRQSSRQSAVTSTSVSTTEWFTAS